MSEISEHANIAAGEMCSGKWFEKFECQSIVQAAIDAAVAEDRAKCPRIEWHSVGEPRPKDGVYLVSIPTEDEIQTGVWSSWREGDKHWFIIAIGSTRRIKPTHWAKMPEKPL